MRWRQFWSAPRGWWWPILAGVAFTPLAFCVAVLSLGFGHGDGGAETVLFPLRRPIAIALNSETAAVNIVYVAQYVIYGAVLAFANRQRRLLPASGILLGFHAASYFARDLIAHGLIRMGF